MPKRTYEEYNRTDDVMDNDDVMNNDEIMITRDFISRSRLSTNDNINSLIYELDKTNSDIIIDWLYFDYNKDAIFNANIEELEYLSYILRYNIDDIIKDIKRYAKSNKNLQEFLTFFYNFGTISQDVYRRYINPSDKSFYYNNYVTGVLSDPSYIRSSERINSLLNQINNNSVSIINKWLLNPNNRDLLLNNIHIIELIHIISYLTNINSLDTLIENLRFYIHGKNFEYLIDSLFDRRIITKNDRNRYLSPSFI